MKVRLGTRSSLPRSLGVSLPYPRSRIRLPETRLKLLGRPDGKLAAGERDYLDALVVLVEDHDRKNSRFVPASLTPAEALKYLAEQAEMGPTALGKVLERLTRWRP